jgi:hypothetical protein
MIKCIFRGIRLPFLLQDYMTQAYNISVGAGMWLDVQESMMRFANLQADIKEESLSRPQDILVKALELDRHFLSIVANTPPAWQYKTVYTDVDSDLVYNGKYHSYYDYCVAMVWNNLRMLRIMCNRIIRGALLTGFSSTPSLFAQPDYTVQFHLSMDIILEMRNDILATVPQYIGRGNPPIFKIENLYILDPANKNYPPIPTAAGTHLMWPIWFVGQMNSAYLTEPVRNFAAKILRYIGEIQGIQQANFMALMVETRKDIQI